MSKNLPLLVSSLILLLLIPAVVFAGHQPSQTKSQTFSVPATAGDAAPPTTWFDTGFDLISGQPVTVTASGTALFCPTPGLVGGGGCSTTPAGPIAGSPEPTLEPGGCPACPADNVPLGTLIAKVGTAPPVVVGAGPVTLTGSGRLLFAYNDGYGDHFDNSGSYSVTITYNCAPGNGFGDPNHYHCGP